MILKLWQNKNEQIFVWDAQQKKVSAASYKKDIIFGGHPKQIFVPSYFDRALVVEQPFIAAQVRVSI